jgi:hypothetical protein
MRRFARLCAVALSASGLAVTGLGTQPASAAPWPVSNLVVTGRAVIDSSGPTTRLTASWTLPSDATGAYLCERLGSDPPQDCPGSPSQESFSWLNVAGPASSASLPFGAGSIIVTVVSYDAGGVTGPPVSATLRATTQLYQKVTSFLIYGQRLGVSTRLTHVDDGSPVAGKTIDLVACSVVANSCQLVAHLTADANGVASYVVTATNTDNYRFVHGGAAGLGASFGFKSLITRFGIVTHITRTTVRVGHPTYLWGRLTPKLTGARVYLFRASYVPTRYVKVAYQKMPNGVWMTGYKIAFKPSRVGKYRITALKQPRRTATVYIAGAHGKWFTVTAV